MMTDIEDINLEAIIDGAKLFIEAFNVIDCYDMMDLASEQVAGDTKQLAYEIIDVLVEMKILKDVNDETAYVMAWPRRRDMILYTFA